MPEIDDEHLLDTCLSHVKKLGETGAFALGKYLKTGATHAVRGAALADLLHLLEELHKVSPSLEFKYSTLKSCFSQVLQQFPGIKEKWPVSEQGDVGKALSDAILVVCNHARRISRDKSKFAEACKNLTAFQVEKLEAIRSLVIQKNGEKSGEEKPGAKPTTTPKKRTPHRKAASPATPKRRKQSAKAASPVSQGSPVSTDFLANFEIPCTQEESEEDDGLLASAKKSQPVPPRKAKLREEVGKKKELKRLAAALLKKPASKNQGKKKHEKFEDSYKLNSKDKLLLMPYKKLASCALRIKNGRQLIQVVSPQGFEESKKMAMEMKKMFENGKCFGEVKAWKEKKLSE